MRSWATLPVGGNAPISLNTRHPPPPEVAFRAFLARFYEKVSSVSGNVVPVTQARPARQQAVSVPGLP